MRKVRHLRPAGLDELGHRHQQEELALGARHRAADRQPHLDALLLRDHPRQDFAQLEVRHAEGVVAREHIVVEDLQCEEGNGRAARSDSIRGPFHPERGTPRW